MAENVNALLEKISERLSDSQKEKAKKCNTIQELTEFMAKEGIELSDEIMEQIAGGSPLFTPTSRDKDGRLVEGLLVKQQRVH